MPCPFDGMPRCRSEDSQLIEADNDVWDCLQTIVDTVERTVQAFMEQQGVQRAYA